MRLHYGPVPENPDFRPQDEGWTPLVEPSVTAFTWLAGGVGVVVGIGAALLWAATAPSATLLSVTVRPGQSAVLAALLVWGKVLGAVALLVVVHELLHAASYPGRLFGPRTIIGVWPTKGLFYAHYDGPLSRNRFLLVLLMPFLILTAGFWLVELVARTGWGLAPGWSVLNAVFSGGDLLAAAMVAWQIPPQAEVRNQGWQTWWRLPPPADSPPESERASGP
jgi:hypothetical protein